VPKTGVKVSELCLGTMILGGKVDESSAMQIVKRAVDLGLGAVVKDPAQNGKFRTASLRNVAKTAPYSHNGYFKSIATICT
jgi:cytochrome c peroxidase